MHFENWAWSMRWTLQLILLWLKLLNVFERFSVWMSVQMLYCLSICLPCFQNMLTCFIVAVYYNQYLAVFFCKLAKHSENHNEIGKFILETEYFWMIFCVGVCQNALKLVSMFVQFSKHASLYHCGRILLPVFDTVFFKLAKHNETTTM